MGLAQSNHHRNEVRVVEGLNWDTTRYVQNTKILPIIYIHYYITFRTGFIYNGGTGIPRIRFYASGIPRIRFYASDIPELQEKGYIVGDDKSPEDVFQVTDAGWDFYHHVCDELTLVVSVLSL